MGYFLLQYLVTLNGYPTGVTFKIFHKMTFLADEELKIAKLEFAKLIRRKTRHFIDPGRRKILKVEFSKSIWWKFSSKVFNRQQQQLRCQTNAQFRLRESYPEMSIPIVVFYNLLPTYLPTYPPTTTTTNMQAVEFCDTT